MVKAVVFGKLPGWVFGRGCIVVRYLHAVGREAVLGELIGGALGRLDGAEGADYGVRMYHGREEG
ncbi:hypothetical protein GCM10027048_42770 [Hymenobacter coalescens]